jgi:methyltransferase (TIGR00027 family)
MDPSRASRTAEYVAAMRGMGALLPESARLVDGPWGAEWTGYARLRRWGTRVPGLGAILAMPAWPWLLYMQVRTHALDEVVRGYARSGGKQLVLLGAGLDARALRLRDLGIRVFEVDHPATQARKREVIGDAATLVAWNFEVDPLRDLPARLASVGYDLAAPGCVLWEGVTMYLSEGAIDESLAMMRSLLAPGSTLAFTYFTRALIDRPTAATWFVRHFVARRKEPWIFGWEPSELPAWLAARGFTLESDDETWRLGKRYLPSGYSRWQEFAERHIATARRT